MKPNSGCRSYNHIFICCSVTDNVFRPRLVQNPGGYFQIRRSGGLDLTSSLEAKFGARSGQVHQMRGKIWEVLSPQDEKLGKSPNFGVISEIQSSKFGVFVIYHLYFWRQNFGPSPPPTSQYGCTPWGSKDISNQQYLSAIPPSMSNSKCLS